MTTSARPVIDARDSDAFVDALLARRAGFVGEWQPGDSGADIALAQVLGRYLGAIVMRLDQAPDKHQLAMLDQLGVDLIPAQASRAPVVFALADNAADARVPAGRASRRSHPTRRR